MAEKVVKLSSIAEETAEEELKVIIRDTNPPDAPPYLDEGTEFFDPTVELEPKKVVDKSWGGKPNVPIVDVIKAIRRDIGAKGFDLHISDRSYTGYTIWDVIRYLKADRTNLMRYHAIYQ
ncbi:MAG: hypothetical protein ACXQT4_04040 [Methanotrichaceae archaeon]